MKIKCDICGKEFLKMGMGAHIWRKHGTGIGFASNKGKASWNKGLTKHNNSSLKQMAEKISKNQTGKPGHKHSDESKRKISNKQLENVKNGIHIGWTSRKIKSWPETYFESALNFNGFEGQYKFNYPIQRNKSFSFYFLDFYFEDIKLDLEIDGSQHEFLERKISDDIRDKFLTEQDIIVYRIKWVSVHDSNGKIHMMNEVKKLIHFIKSKKAEQV